MCYSAVASRWTEWCGQALSSDTTADEIFSSRAYVERMEARPAYKKAVQRIVDETGEYNPEL